MKRSIPILLWLITFSICIFPRVFACGANPTTIGSYYSGPLLPGATIVFTGAQSHDNDAINGGNTPRWDWDFDYHAPSFQADTSTTSAYPSWTYSQAGVYTVAVRYHDEENCIGNLYTFQVTLSGLKRLYYLKDHLGTIRATVDAVGEVVSADDYDSWGMQLEGRSINLADANPKYKFTGKERDVETGYDYFGARYYDSRIARFLSIDRFHILYPAQSPYHYALNNPLSFIDINGDSAKVVTDKTTKKITFINDGKSKTKDEDGNMVDDKAASKEFDVRTDVVKGHTEIEGDKDGKISDDLKPKNIAKSKSYGDGDGTYIDSGRADGKDIHGGGLSLKDPYAKKQGWVKTHGCQRMQNVDIKALSKLIKDYKRNHPGEKVPGYVK